MQTVAVSPCDMRPDSACIFSETGCVEDNHVKEMPKSYRPDLGVYFNREIPLYNQWNLAYGGFGRSPYFHTNHNHPCTIANRELSTMPQAESSFHCQRVQAKPPKRHAPKMRTAARVPPFGTRPSELRKSQATSARVEPLQLQRHLSTPGSAWLQLQASAPGSAFVMWACLVDRSTSTLIHTDCHACVSLQCNALGCSA